MGQVKCDYKWEAPVLWPPGTAPGTFIVQGLGEVQTNKRTIPQECSLSKGHEGPHRSLSNVTKE